MACVYVVHPNMKAFDLRVYTSCTDIILVARFVQLSQGQLVAGTR